MDTSIFSKETLITMIKDQQALIHKQTTLIQEQQTQILTQSNFIHEQKTLTDKQRNLIDTQGTLLAEYKPSTPDEPPSDEPPSDEPSSLYNEDTKEVEIIDTSFNHGTGPLRYKQGDTYYHGLGSQETKYSWYRKCPDTYFRGIIEYKSEEHPLPHIEWDTHGAHEFCTNCVCDVEASRKKRVLTIYRCQGHTIL
jgi:hypothetical protein